MVHKNIVFMEFNKMKKLSLPIISTTAISLTVVALVLRIISLFAFYDALGYYQTGAVVPIITNIITAVSIVMFFIAAILCVKSDEKINAPQKEARYAAILPLGTLVFFVSQSIIELTKNTTESSTQSNLIPIITIIGALAGIVFFFLIFFTDKQKIATVYCGLGALIFVFFSWMSAYFDFSSPINSTQRILFYVACTGAMLFIFNEMCAIYGSVKPKFYYFSLFVSILTLASSAIPALIGFAANKFSVYFTLKEDIFFTALFIYAIVRLVTLCIASKKTPQISEEINETTDAEETSDAVKEENFEEKTEEISE